MSVCRCALEREQAFLEVRARVQRVDMTEAMRAEMAAKQALYERERRAWRAEWRKEYSNADDPTTIIDPAHVAISTLLV